MHDLQRYPWKLCLIKHELDINVFFCLNCLFSFLWESNLRNACLQERMQKTGGIFQIFGQIKSSRIPLQIGHCMKDIDLVEFKVLVLEFLVTSSISRITGFNIHNVNSFFILKLSFFNSCKISNKVGNWQNFSILKIIKELPWKPRVAHVTPTVYPHFDSFYRETNCSLYKSIHSTYNLKTKLGTLPGIPRVL